MEKILRKSSYEFFLVLSSKLGEEKIEATVKKFEELIPKNGELKSVDKWGRRKFAYPINKETEGEYILFNFESGTQFPMELDRISRITEGVLRALIVKKDEREEARREKLKSNARNEKMKNTAENKEENQGE